MRQRLPEKSVSVAALEQISVSGTFRAVPVLFHWLSSELTLIAFGRFGFVFLPGTFQTVIGACIT